VNAFVFLLAVVVVTTAVVACDKSAASSLTASPIPTSFERPTPSPTTYSTLIVEDGIRFSFEYPLFYNHTEPVVSPGGVRSIYTNLYYPGPVEANSVSRLFVSVLYTGGGVVPLNPPSPKAEIDKQVSIWSSYPGFKLVGRSSREVGGLPAEEMAYYMYISSPESPYYNHLSLYRWAVFNQGNDRQYKVFWTALAEISDLFWGDFDHVLKTFKLLD
jgi:hypothetical protein